MITERANMDNTLQVRKSRQDQHITHLLSWSMDLLAWVMSWETPESKSNSFEYWLVVFEMVSGEKDPFLPLLCKKHSGSQQ